MPIDQGAEGERGGLLSSVAPVWAEANTAAAYQAWHPVAVDYYRPVIDALVAEAGVRTGARVLDIGTGTGIPALAVAEAVGSNGHVVATDPSSNMLAAARENGRAAGLRNLKFVQAVAESLPFADGTFDAVVSQTGIMFVADLGRALAEIRRVTREDARAAFVAWGPYEKNPTFSVFWDVARRFREESARDSDIEKRDVGGDSDEEPRAEPDPRDPFRFAAPGSLSAALRNAAFVDVREEHRSLRLPAPGRGEALEKFWLDFTHVEQEFAADLRARFREQLRAAYGRYADSDHLNVPAVIVLASGRV